MDVEFQSCISNGPVSFHQAYGYGPYGGAYPPGTQVVYAANRPAFAVPYRDPYAGKSCVPVVLVSLRFGGRPVKTEGFLFQFKDK